MNILIDVNHPAQVHYFRNLYKELSLEHNIYLSCKKVPLIEKLLSAYNIPYKSYGEKKDNILSKVFYQLKYDFECYTMMKNLNIDIALGSSASNVHAAKFTKVISIATTDSDLSAIPLATKFVYPFADYLMMPDTLAYQNHPKQICYPGYQELAYLHPNRFEPNPTVLEQCNLRESDTFFLLRFTAFKAHHDIGMYGLSKEQKWDLIKLLEKYGRVLITSEVNDPEFTPFYLHIAPEKIHSLLYYSSMLICDSQTMTTEAAVLGTPAFRCNTFAGKLTVIEEIEKLYDLAYSYHPRHYNWMIRKIKSVLDSKDYKKLWQEKRKRMLQEKIDVTAFWVWLIENAPSSLEKVKRNKIDFDEFK